jgi:lysophospholipase
MSNTKVIQFFQTHDRKNIRYGVWPSQTGMNKGSVILLNGRGEFIEKYTEMTREFNERGLDVYSLDWRGQGLSTRELDNRQKGFVDAFETYVKDLKRFVDDIVAANAAFPVIMFGHSMGAHIGLRFIHDNAALVSKAVFTSPLIDLPDPVLLKSILQKMTRLAVKFGWVNSYVIGSGDYNPAEDLFTNNRYTSDRKRFNERKQMLSEKAELALGGVTYGWVDAMFKSIRVIHQAGYAEAIQIPILIVGAGKDKVVSVAAQKKISRRLPRGKYIEIADARHEIMMEVNGLRSQFWTHFDRFILPLEEETGFSRN